MAAALRTARFDEDFEWVRLLLPSFFLADSAVVGVFYFPCLVPEKIWGKKNIFGVLMKFVILFFKLNFVIKLVNFLCDIMNE